MADKKTIDKVKELIDSNAAASLKEAAEKWLAAVDEKYGDKIDEIKDKAAPAMEKIGEYAEKYSEKSIEANEKLKEVGEKVAKKADEISTKAGPAIEELKEKAAPAVDQIKEKAAPAVGQIKEKAAPAIDKIADSEFIAKLKESVSTVGEVIDAFSKPEMKDKVGEEAAEQIRKHAEALKEEGKTFCDCPACTKAREILRDLGVDLETESEE